MLTRLIHYTNCFRHTLHICKHQIMNLLTNTTISMHDKCIKNLSACILMYQKVDIKI